MNDAFEDPNKEVRENTLVEDSLWGDYHFLDNVDLSQEEIKAMEAVDIKSDPSLPCEEELIHMENQMLIDEEGELKKANDQFQLREKEKYLGITESAFVDLTEYFTTDEVFESRDKLVEWCRDVGKKVKCILVTIKSDSGKGKKKVRITLGCERSGHCHSSQVPQKRNVFTRKCDCQFQIRGVNDIVGNKWRIIVKCGIHNHSLPHSLVGHPYPARLTKDQKALVYEMTNAGCRPRDILIALQHRFGEGVVATLRSIYNSKAYIRRHEKEGRTTMQQLMKVIVEKHYVYWHRKEENTGEVLDLFWAHPDSILLAKCFPSLVVVDCTYKTNRYGMPLFAMVGMTSTGKTFSIAHCFLYKEYEDHYRWALDRLKMLFSPDDLPKVFVTDREPAVIKAIERVFPDASRMLCTYHISRNVEQKAKKAFKSDAWQTFIKHFTGVINSPTEAIFEERWESLMIDWKMFKEVIKYLVDNVFPFREFFVHAWTKSIKHLGNRTTNRAEGCHSTLKKHLISSQNSFDRVWVSFDNMLSLQMNDIKASFESSMGSWYRDHQGMLFQYINGKTSVFSLNLIVNETKKMADIGIDPLNLCDHELRTIYGLPCAHELLQFSIDNHPIPLDKIDNHWRKLTILPKDCDPDNVDQTMEMISFKKLYLQSTEDEKKMLLSKLKEISMPTTTLLKEPISKTVHKGRPPGSRNKMSQKERKHVSSTKRDPSGHEFVKCVDDVSKPKRTYASQKKRIKYQDTKVAVNSLNVYLNGVYFNLLEEIPEFYQKYIHNIENVDGDGHCGFRCVAEHLGIECGWIEVRKKCIMDLEKHREKYEKLLSPEFIIDLRRRLPCFTPSCDIQNWMTVLDCAILIANVFQCIVVHISHDICLSFAPHDAPYDSRVNYPVIALALNKRGTHFFKIYLKEDAPLPKFATIWEMLAYPHQDAWETLYKDRMNAFVALRRIDYEDDPVPIRLDDS